jgi:aryl-alcohol dehydrogenase-like predicted oxidoreductase
MNMPDTSGIGRALGLSRLAFGCAPVMGRVNRNVSLRAMETALDLGVTHFDVARSYGYGEAEAVLGAFATGKRDRITIATKFGIRASRSAAALRWIKPALRQVASLFPQVRGALRAASARHLVAGHYAPSEARRSFEESLRQLKTDYADILFIHDCSPADALSDELLYYLQSLLQAGRIRAWGIATRAEYMAPVWARLPVKPMVMQCAQDLLHPACGATIRNGMAQTIFHSPFGASGAKNQLLLLLKLPLFASPLREIAPRLSGPDGVARLLLEGALFQAEGSPVLCSMFNPAHIRANVDALENPWFTPSQLSALSAAIRANASMELPFWQDSSG